MRRVGVWLLGFLGLAAIAVAVLLVFEGFSYWPNNDGATPKQIAETQFRRCPAVVMAPPRPSGAPVDDLASLRPGQSRQDAENIFACMEADYRFEMALQPYEAPGQARQVYDVLVARRAGVEWRLGLFGPKGKQAVSLIRRNATFSPARAPVIASMEAEVLRHFGPVHEAHDLPTGGRQLTWTYLRDGKPVRTAPVEGSPGYLIDLATFMAAGFTQSACAKHARLDDNAPPSFDIRCGITIRVAFDASPQDRERAWRVRQVIVDQRGLATALGPPAAPK